MTTCDDAGSSDGAPDDGRESHDACDPGGLGEDDGGVTGDVTWLTERDDATVAVRACAWCAADILGERRPGRPRLYCRHACRQRAYEHRHGFLHQRTVRELPGQATGQRTGGTGYERGMTGVGRTAKVHAMRTSVRPEGHRRETLCGALALASPPGRHFSPRDPRACRSCTIAAANAPLTFGIHPSNELSRLRALIQETVEQRLAPAATVDWLTSYRPEVPPGCVGTAA